MKAKNITDRICRDFCDWLRDLGGTNKVIDEEILADMFEIDFSADASRTIEVGVGTKCGTDANPLRNCDSPIQYRNIYCNAIRDVTTYTHFMLVGRNADADFELYNLM